MSLFDKKFTNLYSLQKTLRFELKPVGKTLENMRNSIYKGKKNYDPELQTFLHDQDIEDAYQKLKPLLDHIHEQFISNSLDSVSAKKIDFSQYLKPYSEKADLDAVEKKLRDAIGKTYVETGESWKKKYTKYEWKKGSKVTTGFAILSSQDILQLIKDTHPNDKEIKKIVDETFKGFFTYFGGFNQNRENYYETDTEKPTAVATRIVHENLPKFCDNLLQFEAITKKKKDGTINKTERKQEYLEAYHYLKKNGKTTQIKDAETGKMIEAVPITEKVFNISYFTSCLSQAGIEEYNRIIGHYNLLINLYNQAKENEETDLKQTEKTFKKLPIFKTLYKQIGCGKKKPLFFTLTHHKKSESVQARKDGKETFSVEEVLILARHAGEKYFLDHGHDEYSIPALLQYISAKDNYEGIYWSKKALNTISDKYFANYHLLKDRLIEAKIFQKTKKEGEEGIRIPDAVELQSLFEILDHTDDWKKEGVLFKKALTEDRKDKEQYKKNQARKDIIEKAKKPSQALLDLIFTDITQHIEAFLTSANSVLSLKEYKSEQSIEIIKEWMDHALAINQMVKYFLVNGNKIKGTSIDSTLAEILKLLLFECKIDGDNKAEVQVDWFKWFDALRNFLTKKPQNDVQKNKLKLNFENGTLADGWDTNKESTNQCVILKDFDEKMLLVVMKESSKTLFQKEWKKGQGTKAIISHNPLYQINNSEFYIKMEYDFWSDVSRMIPKCSTQVKSVITHFKHSTNDFVFPAGYKVTSGEQFENEFRITKKEFELNNKVYKKSDLADYAMRYNLSESQEKQYIKQFQKEYWLLLLKAEYPNISKEMIISEWKQFCKKKYNQFSNREKLYKNALSDWINFCKRLLKCYPKTKLFDYSFKETNDYNSIDEFYLDVDISSYKLKTNTQINKKILDQWVDEGKIYLFNISNQDTNDNKHENHKQNLHTLYWQSVFQEKINRPKLNGKAKIFYRKALSKDDTKKKIVNGKEIIVNYRFSKEKFIFHVPITLNFCLKNEDINPIINEQFSPNHDTHFLGVDRGEKHLAYYSLVNKDGKIIDQGSLNQQFINQDGKAKSIKRETFSYDKSTGAWKPHEVDCWDYNDLLETMSSNRDMARKNWKTIGTIKELKEGYISQIIRKIADLAIENNAFIVLEDLNTGFKRGRQKIEKSVYQKFEVALAKKLNFLVDKTKQTEQIGSVTNALQLTPPVNNYGDIENRKQVGIMLYTRAHYTSQTDPVTGWRKTIYIKSGSNEEIKKQIQTEFSDIHFDGKDYVFTYTHKETGKPWKLYSGMNGKSLDRFKGSRGTDKYEWVNEKQDIVKMLNGIFEDFDKGPSLLSQIITEEKQLKKINTHSAWESLRFAIDLIQQIRNTGTGVRDNDFILSPVRDENDKHFDSREYWDHEQLELKKATQERVSQPLPTCGDANGAYNIARKGFLMNEHICIWKQQGEAKYDKNTSDLNLFISDFEWDLYLADKKKWRDRLHIFASRRLSEEKKRK